MTQDPNRDEDLGTHGAKDKAKGKVNEVAGAVQKKVGQVTGDPTTEAKGAARQATGKARSKAGDVEQNVDEKLKDTGA